MRLIIRQMDQAGQSGGPRVVRASRGSIAGNESPVSEARFRGSSPKTRRSQTEGLRNAFAVYRRWAPCARQRIDAGQPKMKIVIAGRCGGAM